MAFEGLRARFSARTRDIVFQKKNGTPNTSSSSIGRPTPKSSPFRLKPWSRLRVRTRFRILDVILNCILFTPLAVLFQVGASAMQDFLFLRFVTPAVGTAILLGLGIGIEFACSFWQQGLSRMRVISENDPMAVQYIVVTRLYHYAIGFANVCHYRGLSDIYYYLLGNGVYGAIQALSTSIIALSGLKCARNVLGPPMCVSVDSTIDQFFDTSTYFRTKNDRYVHHLADNLMTVLTVTSLCCLHWIAVWALFDCIVYPSNPTISVLLSWAIGYSIVFAMFLLESRFVRISRELEKKGHKRKVIFEDVILLLANAGVILVWRGHWVFFESLAYYFPIYHNDTDMSGFYGNFSSFIMMCFLHTSATLIMKGCDFDGDFENGEGLNFGVDYFAEFFQEELKEEEELENKELKELEAEQRESEIKGGVNNNMQKKNKMADENKNVSPSNLVTSQRFKKFE